MIVNSLPYFHFRGPQDLIEVSYLILKKKKKKKLQFFIESHNMFGFM